MPGQVADCDRSWSTVSPLHKHLAGREQWLDMYLAESVCTLSPSDKAEFDQNLIDFGYFLVPEVWNVRLRQKLANQAHVFSTHEWDVVLAKGVELSDLRPGNDLVDWPLQISRASENTFKKCYRQGSLRNQEVPMHLLLWLWKRTNGSIRMCIDYRLLNSHTVPDQYTTVE